VLQEGPQFLAANLPNARLVVLDGWQMPPAMQPDRVDANARLIDEFTGVPLPDQRTLDAVSPTAPQAPAGTAIVLFTDIAESTALTERMGDAAFRAAARTIDEGVREAIQRCGGSPVDGKVLGDGVMGVFSSATQAIDAARQCLALGEELPMHIGLHAGDVIREADNVYGGAVNIASRICGLCEPGEILVSATIRELARTSAGVTFEDRGKHMLKGIDDPLRIFAVRARD
jgi:class 3 adenylate cyclase